MRTDHGIAGGGRYHWGMAHAVKVTDADIEKRLAAIKFARGSLADLAPAGVSLADELIAERRAEARREGHDAKARRRGGD
jgi:hypothetical protein